MPNAVGLPTFFSLRWEPPLGRLVAPQHQAGCLAQRPTQMPVADLLGAETSHLAGAFVFRTAPAEAYEAKLPTSGKRSMR